MWKTRWILDTSDGNTNLHATSPTLDRTLSGPMYLGTSFSLRACIALLCAESCLQSRLSNRIFLWCRLHQFWTWQLSLIHIPTQRWSALSSIQYFIWSHSNTCMITVICNLIKGECASHWPPKSITHIRIMSSKVCMVLSGWPSVWGWKVILKSNLVPKALYHPWSINLCNFFIIDLPSVLTCTRLPADLYLRHRQLPSLYQDGKEYNT